MKIAVTASAPQLDAPLDPRFGRCPYFLIIETDDLNFEAVENPGQALGQGAGIQAARLVAERGVRCVLTGHCGPNAHQALTAAEIEVVVGCTGTARQIAEQYQAGQVQPAPAPDVPGHAGLEPSSGNAPLTDVATSRSAAPVEAQIAPRGGLGRGMGRGRGGMGLKRGGHGRGYCGGRGSI